MAAQLPDRILCNNGYFKLCTNPLELYWESLRKKRPRFCATDECKRGYVATWEIKGGELFLREVKGTIRRIFNFWGKKEAPYSLKDLFGRKKSLVKATWFSGKLRIPVGQMIIFADNAYDSRYAKEVIATVTNGDVEKVVTLDQMNQTLTVNDGSSIRKS